MIAVPIVPGAYPAGASWWRPPHLHWTVRAQGLKPLTTQSYFDGSLQGIERIRELNAADHILNMRQGFDEGLRGKELTRARQRVAEELVVDFVERDELPTGTLTLRLAS